MISKKDYKEAKEVISKYEDQLKKHNGKPCFILIYKKDVSFVTLNEEWAQRVLAEGQHSMIKSKIVNP